MDVIFTEGFSSFFLNSLVDLLWSCYIVPGVVRVLP
jgi:hypothetical protein